MRQIIGGATDQSVTIRIIDSTAGTPEEGVDACTTGLALWYRREGATKTDLSCVADLCALDSAHADEGLIHIDDGYYRLDLPDAAVAAGVSGVTIGGTATGMIVIGEYIEIITEQATASALATVDSNIDAIKAVTDNLPDSGALNDLATILADTADIQPKLGTFTDFGSGATVAGNFIDIEAFVDGVETAIAALNDLSASDVATEIADALRSDTLTATGQAAPATTPTFMAAVMLVYDALIHRVDVDSCGNEKLFYNNAGTVIWKKAVSDDGTVYSEAESATGP